MRTAIVISLTAHIIVGLVWFRIVKISHVRFVPRDVYTVSLVTPAEARKQVQAKPVIAPPEPVKQEKEEELAPPPEKPKPKPKPKPPPKEAPKEVKKTMPTENETTQPSSETPEPGESQEVSTGDIALDGQDFPYAYYLTTIKRKIASFWRVPGASSQEMYCVVYFNILRGGTIESPTIETSSGNLVFDQAALRAVVQAHPLPPLPSGFGDDHLGVHFSFAYERK